MSGIKNIFSKRYIQKYAQKIAFLGPNNKLTIEGFLLSRLLLSSVILLICLLIPKYGILFALVLVPIFYYLYSNFMLDSKIRIRTNKLYDEAILFISMLKLAYIEIKDIKQSLELVSNKSGNSISLTFKKVLADNKYNNDLNDVFNRVLYTICNDDVKKALLDLKETNDYIESFDNSLRDLKSKNLVLVRQSYQLKPFILLFIGIIFIVIIIILLFNIFDIVDYLNNLISK